METNADVFPCAEKTCLIRILLRCTEFACSPRVSGVSSGDTGFLLQSKDVCWRLAGMSELSVVCERVCDCALMGWRPVQGVPRLFPGIGSGLPTTLYRTSVTENGWMSNDTYNTDAVDRD